MTPRWMIERKRVIEVYAENENKELVKSENKQWSYERELLLVEGE